MAHRSWPIALAAATVALGTIPMGMATRAYAAPAPEVEYVYNVMVRRHYDFPNNDAIGYGHGICDKVSGGQSYAQVMGDVKNDVTLTTSSRPTTWCPTRSISFAPSKSGSCGTRRRTTGHRRSNSRPNVGAGTAAVGRSASQLLKVLHP